MNEIDVMDETSASRIEQAFEHENVPALVPKGPQQVVIDDTPKGAMVVAVNRNPAKIFRDLGALAAAAGDDWFYRWPVEVYDKKTNTKKTEWVEGPSVKCTNAVARHYGNCRVEVRAFDSGDHWMLYARFYDVETGFEIVRPFQQRKGQNIGGKMDKGRALDIVFQIGVSKATRNVVANALPEYTNYAFQKAKEQLVETVGKNMAKYRDAVKARLEQLGVPLQRVETLTGKTLDKWLAPDLANVIAQLQSIKDGMADPTDIWPADQSPVPTDRPQRADYTEGAAQKRAPAPRKPQPTGKDEVAESVAAAIEQSKTLDMVTLDALDDRVCKQIGNREELRKLWNEAYRVRADEIKKAATQPATTENGNEQTLQDWYKDQIDELAKCTTPQAVDELEEYVVNELAGEDAMQQQFKDLCLERTRSFRKR